jgi:hypothetical protein
MLQGEQTEIEYLKHSRLCRREVFVQEHKRGDRPMRGADVPASRCKKAAIACVTFLP